LRTGLIAGAVLSPLNSTMIAAALPVIERDFAVSETVAVMWLTGGYLLVGIVALAPAGRIADAVGYGRVFAVGLATTLAGTVCALLSGAFPTLAVGRLLMAAGGSCIIPSAMALLRLHTPPERTAHVLGAFGALMAGAAVAGTFLGGLVAHWGWHAVFLANIPPMALAVAALPTALRDPPKGRREAFDLIGSVLLGLGLAALVVSVKAPAPTRWWCLGGGALALLLFVAQERRVASPVLDLALFRVGAFAGGSGVVALHNAAMYSLLFAVPHLLPEPGHHTIRDGAVISALAGTMMIGGFVGGRLAARIGVRALSFAASLAALAGTLALAASLPRPSLCAACLALAGAGIGLATGPSNAAAMGATSRERSGMAASALSIMRYLGALVGTAALGVVFPYADHPWIFISPFAAALAISIAVSQALPGRTTPAS
jgi:MFS family permease